LSPDLAPFDFYLFGFIKGKVVGRQYETPEDLFCEVKSIIEGIPRRSEKWLRILEGTIAGLLELRW
jgi:hypothetical protein